MAGLWEIAGSLGGSNGSPSIGRYTAGAGGWAKGDPLVASSGKLIKATAGSATTSIKWVAAQVCAADAVGLAYELLPNVKLRIGKSGSPAVGTAYGITATTFLVDATNTTQKRVMVIGVDEVDATIMECISLDWLS